MKKSVNLMESFPHEDQVERDTIEIFKVGYVDYISGDAEDHWAEILTNEYMKVNNMKYPSPSLPDYKTLYFQMKMKHREIKKKFKDNEAKKYAEIKVKYTIVHYIYRDNHYQLVIKLNPMDEQTLKNLKKGIAHGYELYNKVKNLFAEYALNNVKIDNFYFEPTIVES